MNGGYTSALDEINARIDDILGAGFSRLTEAELIAAATRTTSRAGRPVCGAPRLSRGFQGTPCQAGVRPGNLCPIHSRTAEGAARIEARRAERNRRRESARRLTKAFLPVFKAISVAAAVSWLGRPDDVVGAP